MSAHNVPTADDILKTLQQVSETPKIKIGDQTFESTDLEGIQRAIASREAALAERERFLTEQQRTLGQQKFVKPEEAPKPGPTPAAPRAGKPRESTPEERVLQEQFDELLGGVLGIEGRGSEALKQLAGVVGLALQNNAQKEEQLKALEQRLTTLQEAQEAGRFVAAAPDYDDTPENAGVLNALLAERKMPKTKDNLHLMYLLAREQGKIAARGQTRGAVPQAPSAPRLPSLRSNAAQDIDSSIYANFDNMSEDQQAEALRRLRSQLAPSFQ